MTFTELATPEELTDFLNANSEVCVITFSATWCGPCKGSKPKLKELAAKSPIPIAYIHEEDLEDFLDVFVQIKSFPTYIVFKNGEEKARVEGVDFAALEKMIQDNAPSQS
jgi:thiol-disulfide isomerase/thioredoxin